MSTLKTTFVNIKLQRLCKSHLQCITSSKDSEKLEKSLCTRDKAEDLCLDARGLRALRRHCITHRHDSVIDITKRAQEYFQKPLLVNPTCHAICRCQLKLYHAKRKLYVNMVQKFQSVSKWKSVLWSDESKCYILVENHRCCVFRTKEEGDLPVCYQRSVQKPASLMVWGCISTYSMGSLHVLEGNSALLLMMKGAYKGFRATYAPLQMTCISAGQCKSTYCSYCISMAS